MVYFTIFLFHLNIMCSRIHIPSTASTTTARKLPACSKIGRTELVTVQQIHRYPETYCSSRQRVSEASFIV